MTWASLAVAAYISVARSNRCGCVMVVQLLLLFLMLLLPQGPTLKRAAAHYICFMHVRTLYPCCLALTSWTVMSAEEPDSIRHAGCKKKKRDWVKGSCRENWENWISAQTWPFNKVRRHHGSPGVVFVSHWISAILKLTIQNVHLYIYMILICICIGV